MAAVFGGGATVANLRPLLPGGVRGVLQAAGLLFFAFAGYARIATLGEEVADPARTIPRAIPLALFLTLAVYTAVAVAGLLAIGPEALAGADAPLAAAVRAGAHDWLAPAVQVGGSLASLGVLLSLIAGITRTSFAMARNHELPAWLAAVHPRHRVPYRAELAVGVLVTAVVLAVDLRGAIGFSSFAVLTYYGIANASAWTLVGAERRWPRPLAGLGVAGCAALAFSLPLASVLTGLAVLATGALVWAVTHRTEF